MAFAHLKGKGSASLVRVQSSVDPAVFLESDWPTAKYLQHHETFATLQAAVEEGCFICTRIREFISGLDGHTPFDESRQPVQKPFTTYRAMLRLDDPKKYNFVEIRTPNRRQMTFRVYQSQECLSPNSLSLSTSSCQTRGLLRSWLKTCSAKHSGCATFDIGDWTPTRVLDIGTVSSTAWKVCIPAMDGILVSEYTTLSYRWGDAQFLKLTSQSLASFRAGSPISNLPQVFQDAISITKDLGIRYIWIDALCIIQDCQQDFDQECAQMSSIYANSSCNLVATFGKDPHTSFFRTRSHEALRIGDTISGRKSDPVYDVWLRFDSIVDERYHTREMFSCEVSSRGWILQELLLAPRAVYFGMNQVHWACRSLEACETWPEGNAPGASLQMNHPFSEGGLDFHSQNTRFYRNMIVGFHWNSIVERYSTLALTNTEDKLVALSGLAKLFQQRTQDEYFAGHWKSALPYSLAWAKPVGHMFFDGWMAKYGRLENACGRSSATYRAPSWSWASIDGLVTFGRIETTLCRVQDVIVNTVGGDPTGRVVNGQLTLRAPWTIVEIPEDLQLDDTLFIRPVSGDPAAVQLSWDGQTIPDCSIVDLAVIGVKYYPSSEKVEEKKVMEICGLALSALEAGSDLHRRVGAFSVHINLEEEELKQQVVLDMFGLESLDKEHRKVGVKEEASLRNFEIV
ncbi:HET-domain-containing protein [Lophium mytilinum]|uniref:HET-domain-containing protein n=1 Tax=Lophium mytilinum TaxID=390894 RepID=A0A6A6R353_9PEZI|nr:HET-domain-containing protein [Lophium mytilinum]